MSMRIKKGDQVTVNTGKDKGKDKGKGQDKPVTKVFPLFCSVVFADIGGGHVSRRISGNMAVEWAPSLYQSAPAFYPKEIVQMARSNFHKKAVSFSPESDVVFEKHARGKTSE